MDKLNWLAESGRERQAEKARKKEQGTERESLKEVRVGYSKAEMLLHFWGHPCMTSALRGEGGAVVIEENGLSLQY